MKLKRTVPYKLLSGLVLGTLLMSGGTAFAHGESIRGGGAGSINTMGAQILEEKVIGLRWDQRNYKTFTDQEMVNFRAQGEDVHAHTSEDAYFLNYGFPVNGDMDINISLQYNNFQNFNDNGDAFATACFNATPNNPACVSKTKDSPGFGDALVTGRYRFYNSEKNQIASVFGIILPTGKIRNRTDNGEIIGTHNQPGGGGIIFQSGVAYSGHLSEKFAMDADLIYRFNTEGAKSFRPGNSVQADMGFSYNHHGFISPVLEINAIFAQEDMENDEVKKNSGGDTVYVTPGVTVHLSEKQSLYANYWIPVFQNLGGTSNDEDYRFSFGWGIALGG